MRPGLSSPLLSRTLYVLRLFRVCPPVELRYKGGIGVIGGIRMSPKMLQDTIDELKSRLEDKDAPFGVDLALPQVGGNARKTNVCSCCPRMVD